MLEYCGYVFLYRNAYPTYDDILEHLRNTINLLRANENFEIALIGENQTFIAPTSIWEVKGGRNVGITTIDMGKVPVPISLAVTEDTIANAFQDYFEEIWDKVPPLYKDKEFVISWLKNKTQLLEQRIKNGSSPER